MSKESGSPSGLQNWGEGGATTPGSKGNLEEEGPVEIASLRVVTLCEGTQPALKQPEATPGWRVALERQGQDT